MVFGQGSFINSAATTPEELARKRAEIAAMMPRFGNARYVGEGLGQLFMGIGLGRQQKALDGQEQQGRASAQERLNAVMGGGIQGRAQPGGFSVLGPMPAPTEAQSVADDTMSALGKTPMRPYRDAIASIESAGSGDYGAIGPTHPELGRALGRYQIMEANIGPWSREVLGREVTPEEFMANPQIQDAIFDGKFGGYVDQFGPEGAAQAWFAGPGGVGKLDRQDSLGTSVADYTAKFSNALGSSPQMTAATIPTDALMSIVMDQWQPSEVRAQAQAMLDQQMKMNDPAYTMGLRADELAIQKAQMEIDQMRNPAAPEVVTERRALAAEAGLRQGTPEYQTFMATGELPQGVAKPLSAEERLFWGIPPEDTRPYVMGKDGVPEVIGGGGVTVNNNMPSGPEPLGTEGQILVPDPNAPGGARVEIAQGSKLDMERQAAADKKTSASDAAIIASDVVTTAANRALEAARNRNFGSGGTSLIGNIPLIGGMTDSGEVLRQNKVLGSQATIETLTAMREASPTGGALGSVTEGELQILKDKSGALDPDSPNYERDLADYTLTLLRTIHGKEAGDAVFRETWQGDMPENLDAAPTPPQGLAIGTVEDGWEYIGGDPAQPESWRKVQ